MEFTHVLGPLAHRGGIIAGHETLRVNVVQMMSRTSGLQTTVTGHVFEGFFVFGELAINAARVRPRPATPSTWPTRLAPTSSASASAPTSGRCTPRSASTSGATEGTHIRGPDWVSQQVQVTTAPAASINQGNPTSGFNSGAQACVSRACVNSDGTQSGDLTGGTAQIMTRHTLIRREQCSLTHVK